MVKLKDLATGCLWQTLHHRLVNDVTDRESDICADCACRSKGILKRSVGVNTVFTVKTDGPTITHVLLESVLWFISLTT